MILVDSCVWIDFMRGSNSREVNVLSHLLEYGDAYICDIVFMEICIGAPTEALLKKYSQQFAELPFLKLPDMSHIQLAEWGHKLRKNGVKPMIADLMIAGTALFFKVPLLTTDQDFLDYKKYLGLRLF